MNLEQALNQRRIANKQVNEIRALILRNYVEEVIVDAKLERASDKLNWKSAPWGTRLVNLLIAKVKIADIRFTPAECNLSKLEKLILESPLTPRATPGFTGSELAAIKSRADTDIDFYNSLQKYLNGEVITA
jgi:hypothetical protein